MIGKRAWNKSHGSEGNRKVKYMFAVTPTDWKYKPSPHCRVGLALTGKISLSMVLLRSKNAGLQAVVSLLMELNISSNCLRFIRREFWTRCDAKEGGLELVFTTTTQREMARVDWQWRARKQTSGVDILFSRPGPRLLLWPGPC